jgi:hypothetical protein
VIFPVCPRKRKKKGKRKRGLVINRAGAFP